MIKRYLIILIASIVVDSFWHAFIAKKLFKKEIGHLMGDKIKLAPGIVFYLINAGALLVFAVNPSLQKQDLIHALAYGGFLGFAMYSTFNFTNFVLLKDWPIKLTILDLLWGSFAAALTSFIASGIIQYFQF